MSEETIPQMRERIEALEKEAKEAQKGRLAAESTARLYEARDAFREKGLNPKHADLFVKTHEGDITADAVSGFASEYNLAPVTSESSTGSVTEGEGSESSADDSGLAAISRAGSSAGDGGAATAGSGPMPREEWEALNKADPAAARAALREGKVQIRADNPWRQR